MVQQVTKRWSISLNLSEYVPQFSTPWWYLWATMIDIDTYRRRIGGLNNNRHKKKKEKEKDTDENFALEDNLLTIYGNIRHCNNSLHIFSNFMVTIRFPIWKEQAKRRSFQIIKLYKWWRKNHFKGHNTHSW